MNDLRERLVAISACMTCGTKTVQPDSYSFLACHHCDEVDEESPRKLQTLIEGVGLAVRSWSEEMAYSVFACDRDDFLEDINYSSLKE